MGEVLEQQTMINTHVQLAGASFSSNFSPLKYCATICNVSEVRLPLIQGSLLHLMESFMFIKRGPSALLLCGKPVSHPPYLLCGSSIQKARLSSGEWKRESWRMQSPAEEHLVMGELFVSIFTLLLVRSFPNALKTLSSKIGVISKKANSWLLQKAI